MNLNYKQRKNIAIASLVLGSTLVIGGMLLFGRIAIPSWLHGSIILIGFFITSFGTKQLRCKQCHKFPDLKTGKCPNCK